MRSENRTVQVLEAFCAECAFRGFGGKDGSYDFADE
jgi:hypothetical protein